MTDKVDKHIIDAVSEWPPLTPEQREKLSGLLGYELKGRRRDK